jgi:hypothetical protein
MVIVVAPTRREAQAIRHGAVAGALAADVGSLLDVASLDRAGAVLVIAGVCGGLDPSLVPGSIIVARGVSNSDGVDLVPTPRLLDAVQHVLRARHRAFVSSRLLTVDAPVASRRAKTELWNMHGAGGVDMETYRLALAAEQRQIPWIAIRAVLDPASAALPASLRAWRADTDEHAIMAEARRRPWEWPAFARLAMQMRTASASLRTALDVVLPALKALAPEDVAPRTDMSIPLVAVGTGSSANGAS